MAFLVNTSPFAGQEGKYVTSRNLKVRRLKSCALVEKLCQEQHKQWWWCTLSVQCCSHAQQRTFTPTRAS